MDYVRCFDRDTYFRGTRLKTTLFSGHLRLWTLLFDQLNIFVLVLRVIGNIVVKSHCFRLDFNFVKSKFLFWLLRVIFPGLNKKNIVVTVVPTKHRKHVFWNDHIWKCSYVISNRCGNVIYLGFMTVIMLKSYCFIIKSYSIIFLDIISMKITIVLCSLRDIYPRDYRDYFSCVVNRWSDQWIGSFL